MRLSRPILEDFAYLARHMRADERAQFLALSGLPEYDPDVAARAIAATPGPTWVYIVDGLPALLGGFEPIRPGVYEGWQMSTDEGWATHWRSFTKISIRLMDSLLADGAHRIQTCALASRTEAHHWYERIGMVNEGTLRGHCADGQNAVLFARTRSAI